MQKMTTCLWFNGQAEEAARFYTRIFKEDKTADFVPNTESSPGKTGSVLTASFTLNGQSFLALNGGPEYQFTPAISLVINCETQQEVDYFWKNLTEGGKEVQCGWLVDKFGVSWQVVPTVLPRLLGGEDKARAERVMHAMMQMVKMDIATLEQA